MVVGIRRASRSPFGAGALNHGLAPRESLLVAADSIFASITIDPATGEVWARRARMFATLNAATHRYPEDPEVWYALADARVHMGANLDPPMPDPQILAVFDRAIALDSSFTPAYIHAIALGLGLGGGPLGSRYLDAYLAHNPPGQAAAGLVLLPSLLDPARARLPQVDTELRSLSPEGYQNLLGATQGWPDTAETAVRIARTELAVARLRPPGDPLDSSSAALDLAYNLIQRGHFAEAIALTRHQTRRGPVVLALGAGAALGVIGTDTTLADTGVLRRNAARGGGGIGQAMPWWAAVGDTVALARVKAISDSLLRAPTTPSRRRALAAIHSAVAPGYLALARHDTAGALRVFEAYPEDHCTFCEVEPLYKARVLAARGREREALAILDRFQVVWPSAWAEIAMLDRGRIAEHLGDKPKAIDSYLVVAEFWRHADPELQPAVREAEEGLRRLSGDAPRTHE